MSLGWLAFDAATRDALKWIEAFGVDRFGEPLRVSIAREPILQALARKPMRACQLAARLGVRRYTLAMALEGLIVQALVARDDEGFYWRAES